MAVYTKLSRADAKTIAKKWGLGEPVSFEGIAKGSVNTNYRLVTAAGTFFVRLDETRTAADVKAEIELVEWLVAHGFPTPEPLADPAGRRVHRLARSGDKPLAVYPFLPGADKDADRYDAKELAMAGAMLAKLHHAAKGYPVAMRNRFGRAATAARWARIRAKARIPNTERAEIDGALASLSAEPPPAGPAGVVHGDWFADNLLFVDGVITGVLDFEAAATDHLTFDVATAVNALCWRPTTPDRFDARRVDALVGGYAKAGGPAALDDACLAFWLRLSALRFTVTRIQDFRLRASSLRVEKDYRDFLKRLRWWSRGKRATPKRAGAAPKRAQRRQLP